MASHLKLDSASNKHSQEKIRKTFEFGLNITERLVKGMLYIFTCWLDFSDVFRMGFDLESVFENSNSLGFSDS